jgi:hypothetical protein
MSYIGNPIVSQAFLTDQFSGTGSATSFILTVAPANSASILVAVSGVLQDPTTYGVAGTTLTFSAAPPSGTANISVRYLGIPSTGVTSTAYRTITEITATASQTTFTPASYTVGFLSVYQNGVLLGSSDYTASNGTSVVLATGATVGDLLLFESFNVSSVLNAIPATPGAVNPSYLAAAGASKAFLDVVNGNGTGGMIVPTGTTAQRPASPVAGTFRYNTSTNQTEVYSGIAWLVITSQTYSVDYLIVGGGGGGAGDLAGGGGAGGYLAGSFTVTGSSSYSLVVGAGGTAGTASRPNTGSSNGNNSTGFGFTVVGGGHGIGYVSASSSTGTSGGSGAGGSGVDSSSYTGAPGSGTSGQGNAGGSGGYIPYYCGGGGGGAGAAGASALGSANGAAGGAGINWQSLGTYYAGGGGGGGYGGGGSTVQASGGLGGGGTGGIGSNLPATAGTANTGGGGGGGGYGNNSTTGAQQAGGAGGSGVIIIRYLGAQAGTGGTVSSLGGYTYHTFTSSGTFTA